MARIAAALLLVVGLGGWSAAARAATAFPTDHEQYMLELINRARQDPAGEAALLGIALNEGLAPGTISTAPKQPLAFDLHVISASQLYAQYLLDHDEFSHTADRTFSQRMTDEGYTGTPVAENLAFTSLPPAPDLTTYTELLHETLFVDSGVVGRGHRLNLLNPSSKEIGVGLRTGSGYDPPPPGGGVYDALIGVQDYGTRSPAFLTGVAYVDLDLNAFYSPGEGRGGITITATRQSDALVQATTTWSSGGYSLELPPGTWDVVATGGGISGSLSYPGIVVGSDNVKLDLDPSAATCGNAWCGDCNGDGQRDIVDALMAARHGAGLITLTGAVFTACNVHGALEPSPSADVSILDALALAQFAAMLPVTLTCC